jgi:gamma-glutamyl-gamma-aminobutyrate hydrolase PuuD
MQGGIGVNKTHYQLIKYCIKNNKPLLGICLGMQAMIMYDFLVKECNKDEVDVTIDEVYSKYAELKAQDKFFITELSDGINHGGNLVSGELEATKDNIKVSTHSINIKEPSILYDIYGADKIDVISMHRFGAYQEGNLFNVIATSDDGVVEGIQYKDYNKFIVGVQFHAEQESDNLLIKKLVEKADKKI